MQQTSVHSSCAVLHCSIGRILDPSFMLQLMMQHLTIHLKNLNALIIHRIRGLAHNCPIAPFGKGTTECIQVVRFVRWQWHILPSWKGDPVNELEGMTLVNSHTVICHSCQITKHCFVFGRPVALLDSEPQTSETLQYCSFKYSGDFSNGCYCCFRQMTWQPARYLWVCLWLLTPQAHWQWRLESWGTSPLWFWGIAP